MTNDEFEKRKEFILGQRAQFGVGMQQLHEAQARTARVVAEMEEAVARCAKETLKGSTDLSTKMKALENSQKRTKGDLTELITKLARKLRRDRERN